MKKSIFRNLLFLSIISCLCTFVLLAGFFASFYQNDLKQQMNAEVSSLTYGYNKIGIPFLEEMDIAIPFRITLVRGDGVVIYDSEKQISTLDNHGDRTEIQEALETGFGEAERYSASFGEKYYYYAIQTADSSVLRISTPLTAYNKVFIEVLPYLAILFVLFVLLILYIANKQVERIIKPLNTKGIFVEKEDNIYPELDSFYQLIEEQREEIKHHLRSLRTQQQEFEEITGQMIEGLVVLNKEDDILSINQSAITLLGAKERSYLGEHFMVLSRNPLVQEAIQEAQKNNQNQKLIELKGVVIQLHASSVLHDNKIHGVLLLILDITNQYQSEQLRREFSSNVSHELKTPLTSIVGYSELLQTGNFKQEDQDKFISRIIEEGNRLISLIDDIMLLSGLDESRVIDFSQQINLVDLIQAVLNRLNPKIMEKDIKIYKEYQTVNIQGNRHLLEELIYNLVDNAIKYNKQNGAIYLISRVNETEIEFIIKDTGIGIPKKDTPRIFERFYRGENGLNNTVDGSGLGLSIVKHIAELHDIKITYNSELHQGTEFILIIKRK